MAVKQWEAIKVQFCDRAGCEVALEAQVVYPSEHLSEQSPRIVSHRCSHGLECIKVDLQACTWSGATNGYDPFQ